MKRRAYYDPDIHRTVRPPDGQRDGAVWACRTILRLMWQDRLAYIQNDERLESAINHILGHIAGLEMTLEGARLDAEENNGEHKHAVAQ